MTKVAVGKCIERSLMCKVVFEVSAFGLSHADHNGFEIARVFPNINIETYKRENIADVISRFLSRTGTDENNKHTLLGFALRALHKTHRIFQGEVVETFERKIDWKKLRSHRNSMFPVYLHAHWFNRERGKVLSRDFFFRSEIYQP